MGLDRVDTLLGRYTQFVPPQKAVQKEITRLIHVFCNIYLPLDSVEIIQNCAYVYSSPQHKKDISKEKTRLLMELRTQFGNRAPKDIR